MTKRKSQTCRFNANRHCDDVAYPLCRWWDKALDDIVFPPHIAFEDVDVPDCKPCKAYERVPPLTDMVDFITMLLEKSKKRQREEIVVKSV